MIRREMRITFLAMGSHGSSFILPFAVDQFFWGKHLSQLELGPKSLPIKSFNVLKFKQAIDDLLHNTTYQKNASAMAKKLSTENGVHNTIRVIECG